MIEFIARFSPRLTALLSLPREVEDVFVAIEDLIHDKGSDPAVQRILNEIRDMRRKFTVILGE
jgi:hypothetical protein